MRRKLPRSTDPTKPQALMGAVWDDAATMMETGDKLVAVPPLMLADGPGGKVLSITLRQRIWFKVKATATKDGTYQVSIMTGVSGGPLDPSTAGALAISDFGNDPDIFSAYAINAQELGQTGHDIKLDGTLLPNPPIYFGWIVNYATDGKPVIAFDSSQWKNC